MNGFSILLLACALLFGWGCSSTSYQTEVNQFSFIYDDQMYSIVSIGVVPGNSVNYLLLREDGTLLLRARDNNLDGVLDTLLVGSITMEKADEIYAHGISQAITEGKYRQSQPSRVFFQRTAEGFYAIQTFEHASFSSYNKFVIHNNIEQTEVIFLDQKADGTLDQIESGKGELQPSQSLYEQLLQAGIQTGQIVRTNGYYLVEPPA